MHRVISYNKSKRKQKKLYKRKSHKRKSYKRKGKIGGTDRTIYGNVSGTVYNTVLGATGVAKGAVDETFKTADKSLEVTGNAIRNSLDTIGATEKAINTSLQETVGLVAETTKSAAIISKEALKTSEIVASSGLNVVDVTSSNVASVANEATTQSAKVANTALKHAGELTSTAVSTASNSVFLLLGTADYTLENNAASIRAKKESITEYYSETQINELNKEAKVIFKNRIQTLQKNLSDYVISQRGFIELSLKAFKMNKCTVGRFYGYTCGSDEQTVIAEFTNKLKVLDKMADANKRLLESLSTQAETALLKIYGENITPPEYKSKANAALGPFYAEATKIFERTLQEFQKLNEELDTKLKENLTEINKVVKEVPTTLSPSPLPVENAERETISGGKKTKRLRNNKSKKGKYSKKSKRVKRKYNKK